MAATIVDQNDLFLPLINEIDAAPPWAGFMARLVAATQARYGFLFLHFAADGEDVEPMLLQTSAPRAVGDAEAPLQEFTKLRLHPYGALRPNRVYALEEMLDFDRPAVMAAQREALLRLGIRYGRWLRVAVEGVADVWIVLTREREDLSAAAAARLSATAPYLRAALRLYVAHREQRLRTALADDALARLGIGRIAFDGAARVIFADEAAERHLSLLAPPHGRPGRVLALPAPMAERLERFCAHAGGVQAMRDKQLVIEIDDGTAILVQAANLRQAPGELRPAAIGTLRLAAREDERDGTAYLRERYRLSAREAALAEKLSRGRTIAEAGRALHLTEETARNYSKRIYARTGSRGQADLVRTILTGLAPLA